MRLLADPQSLAEDFTKPGHVVPLRAKDGGSAAPSRHTEAAADLARMAGLQPAGAICEIVSQRTKARWPRPTSCGCSPTNTIWR